MLNDKGIELLKELMKLDSEQTNITQPESTQPEITEKEPDSNQLNLKLAEEKIKHLELMNNLLEKHLEDLKSENKNLQLDIRESQHRHDTIIMSFSQRFEEMQKRLPMPRKEPEKKPGIIKKFFNWLTAPEQDPTNWEAEDQRFG
jgi:chromosome segregation ATPase